MKKCCNCLLPLQIPDESQEWAKGPVMCFSCSNSVARELQLMCGDVETVPDRCLEILKGGIDKLKADNQRLREQAEPVQQPLLSDTEVLPCGCEVLFVSTNTRLLSEDPKEFRIQCKQCRKIYTQPKTRGYRSDITREWSKPYK